jgi:hypothetical protein
VDPPLACAPLDELGAAAAGLAAGLAAGDGDDALAAGDGAATGLAATGADVGLDGAVVGAADGPAQASVSVASEIVTPTRTLDGMVNRGDMKSSRRNAGCV